MKVLMWIMCENEFDCLLIRYFTIAQNLDPSIIDYCPHTNQYPLDSLTFSDKNYKRKMKHYEPQFISHVLKPCFVKYL